MNSLRYNPSTVPDQIDHPAPAVSTRLRAFCRACGYPLIGLPGKTCPECGKEFDPQNPRTFARRPPRNMAWRWGRRVAALILVLVVTASLCLGWLWSGWAAEQKTIGQLRKLEADFQTKPIGPNSLGRMLGPRFAYLRDRVDNVTFRHSMPAQMEPFDFQSLQHLDTLMFSNCQVNDAILAKLAAVKSLRQLYLWNSKLDKPNFAYLANLPRFTNLTLWGEWVNDSALVHISSLMQLKNLCLESTRVTDAGLKNLHGLSSLEELHLNITPISDAGLEHLKNLKSLRDFSIYLTNVTTDGLNKLKETTPDLQIHDLRGKLRS